VCVLCAADSGLCAGRASFRQKLVEPTERTALLAALALARVRQPDLAVRIFKDPKTYGLFPSRRALHGLLLRIGTDVKEDAAKLPLSMCPPPVYRSGRRALTLAGYGTVHDAMGLFAVHGREPTAFTRACLLRAAVHARSAEGHAAALALLRAPTTESDLGAETSFAFWVTKLLKQLGEAAGADPAAAAVLSEVQARLRDVRAKRPKEFPAALDALLDSATGAS
jgi:hypothetical protein